MGILICLDICEGGPNVWALTIGVGYTLLAFGQDSFLSVSLYDRFLCIFCFVHDILGWARLTCALYTVRVIVYPYPITLDMLSMSLEFLVLSFASRC